MTFSLFYIKSLYEQVGERCQSLHMPGLCCLSYNKQMGWNVWGEKCNFSSMFLSTNFTYLTILSITPLNYKMWITEAIKSQPPNFIKEVWKTNLRMTLLIFFLFNGKKIWHKNNKPEIKSSHKWRFLSSWFQVPVLLEAPSWLPSGMDCDIEPFPSHPVFGHSVSS